MKDFAIMRSRLNRLLHTVLRKPRSNRHNVRIDLLDETRPGRPLPNLPPELWVFIIRQATTIHPDPLDTTQAISFLQPPHSQLRHSQYCASMRQKLDVALVSKVWNEYAQEVLYEFVWISRASQAKALALTLLSQACVNAGGVQSGRYLRRLHIETSTFERCAPADLRTILDCSPQLVVYSDYRSVRRNLYEESCDPRSSPEQLFSALAHPKNSLRRLSWTNYDDISFHIHMSPMLETTAANLEYLELNFCSTHLHSMFSNPPATSTSSTISLTLLALRSLKVTLDNATFSVLSTWSMPSLRNLSVLSADFSYAGTGFSQFFLVHGPKLIQLELGHSSSMIEEHYLTVPPNHPNPIPLADWCPNLREFICSADAEWNWQNPDWIAPHILLPTHPLLEFIGIRDIDKRLLDDIALSPQTTAAAVNDDAPFFPLLEQISSLLHRDAFPALMFIRDMSYGSDLMRCAHPQGRILKFWGNVLGRCRERGVWLEDCNGVNVTKRDLQRAELGLGR